MQFIIKFNKVFFLKKNGITPLQKLETKIKIQNKVLLHYGHNVVYNNNTTTTYKIF